MAQFVPPPRPHELLPPLIACLPTAFLSSRPPPDFLPLLSPILRQRVHLNTASSGGSDGWLPLLSWDAARASKLPDVVERIRVEPHPVSGEVEIEDPRRITFRRLDAETLHSKFELEEFDLLPVYLWCPGDEQGNERGWKLAEVRSLEDLEDGTQWHGSIAEANEQSAASRPQTNGNGVHTKDEKREDSAQVTEAEDDDDAYWAAYDRSNNQTPAKRPSPAPASTTVQLPSASEIEYFARYMTEVQPALDPEDPDEAPLQAGESTLNGNTLLQQRTVDHGPFETSNLGPTGYDSSFPVISNVTTNIVSPRPNSSGAVSPVEELEQRARSVSSAEFGIKQHISTDVKSLYRLAKSAGIDREEFVRIVRTELDVLSLMDME